jgi:cell division protein FtsI/penicillin-binding protein 2
VSERKKSLIALIIVTLALLLIGLLETLLMGEVPFAPPQPIAQAVREAMKYHDGVVVLWNRRGAQHWILGNPQLLQQNFLPGSLMKLITAEAALTQGVDLHYRCEGHHDWGQRRQDCWLPAGHGPLDLPKALALSCNLYFSQLGTQLGWDPLLSVLERYSLSPKQTIPRTPEALRRFSIGEEQSFSVTPLEMTRFWEQYLGQITRAPFQALREGLQRSALEGTAVASAGLGPPLLAKTGTASATHEPYKTHGWFLGAFPPDDPEWAVMIFMKNAHGYREPSELAGKIFKQLAEDGTFGPAAGLKPLATGNRSDHLPVARGFSPEIGPQGRAANDF